MKLTCSYCGRETSGQQCPEHPKARLDRPPTQPVLKTVTVEVTTEDLASPRTQNGWQPLAHPLVLATRRHLPEAYLVPRMFASPIEITTGGESPMFARVLPKAMDDLSELLQPTTVVLEFRHRPVATYGRNERRGLLNTWGRS